MAKIPASYTVLRHKALPGQIADTSLYNIDGDTVAMAAISVGRFVFEGAPDVDADPEGQYSAVYPSYAAGRTLKGVATISHSDAPAFVYNETDSVNVMTHGRVFVEVPVAATLANVKRDTPVVVKADGTVSIAAAVAGDFETGYTFTGELYAHKLDATKKLAKIQLTQGAAKTLKA